MNSSFASNSDFSLFRTDWDFVSEAGEGGPSLQRLVEFYQPWIEKKARSQYWMDFKRNRGEDWVQDFLIKMITSRMVKRADSSKGSFRGFLATCMKYHRLDELKKKRPITADIDDNMLGCIEDLPSIDVYCAAELLQQASRIAQRKCTGKNPLTFAFIKDQFLAPIFDGIDPLSQIELMNKYDLETKGVVAGRMKTAKAVLADSVRCAIRSYTTSEDEVEEEISDFCAAAPLIAANWSERETIEGCLYSEIASDLTDFDRIRCNIGEMSYMELLGGVSPRVDQLLAVKEFAKTVVYTETPNDAPKFSSRAATILYWMTIAVARTNLRHEIGNQSNESVVTGLKSCLVTLSHSEHKIQTAVRDQVQHIERLVSTSC